MPRLLTATVYLLLCSPCTERCSRVSARATLLEPISLWKVLITLTLERDLTRFARACFYDYCCLCSGQASVKVCARLYLCQALSVCLPLGAGGGLWVQGRGLSSTASTLALLKCKHRNVTFPLCTAPFPLLLSAFSSPTPRAASSFSWTASSFFVSLPRPVPYQRCPWQSCCILYLLLARLTTAAYKLPLAAAPVAAVCCPPSRCPRQPCLTSPTWIVVGNRTGAVTVTRTATVVGLGLGFSAWFLPLRLSRLLSTCSSHPSAMCWRCLL